MRLYLALVYQVAGNNGDGNMERVFRNGTDSALTINITTDDNDEGD